MTTPATGTAGVRSPGRAPIAARTLRTDRWWAYPLTTFGVLLAFVAYAAYAAIANRDYYAAPLHLPVLLAVPVVPLRGGAGLARRPPTWAGSAPGGSSPRR
jgi:hypothetical protein